jgi:hypothetical protein
MDVEPEFAAQLQNYDLDKEKENLHKYTRSKDELDKRRQIKRLWNKHADLAFFNDRTKFFVYHNIGHYAGVPSIKAYFPQKTSTPGNVSGIDFPAPNELSCFGLSIKPGHSDIVSNTPYSYFTFKEYRVTFASKEDAETENVSSASPEHFEFYKHSGLRKRPKLKLPFESIPLDQASAELGRNFLAEVIIDNWIIDTYYVVGSSLNYLRGELEYADSLGIKYKII